MPIYEYECPKCKIIKEKMQSHNFNPAELCPKCKAKMNKIISQSTFHLKGNGWYVTDYKKVNKA